MHRLLWIGLALAAALPATAAAPPGREPAHWAFVKPRRPAVPGVSSARAHNAIDSFLLARLRGSGLSFSPPADRRTLLRRLSFDLTGLPPTPEEVAIFVTDRRNDAYERVVERLLASPHHGERWAQHWLDVARYAETSGYESDRERPQAWRYRDWVVAALNADLPYDRFVTLQLGGDLLARAKQGPDLLVAAGFNRCGPIHLTSGNLDPVEYRNELLTEMTAGVGWAFLGLTVNCARCHDHKFDPLSQKDYYRLEAFFSQTRPHEAGLGGGSVARYLTRMGEMRAKLAPVRQRLAALEAPYNVRIRAQKHAKLEPRYQAALAVAAGKRTPEQRTLAAQAETLLKVSWDELVAALPAADRERRAALRRQMHALEAQAPPPPPRAWTLAEGEGPPASYVLRRGNPHRKGARVEPGFPAAVLPGRAVPNNRLGLAAWLTRPDHPLTARVMVNRLWQHHFGAGLVRTPNDFGRRGDRPSHPELLDYLALELVRSGWSLKHVHRLIVLSAAYRQASRDAGPGKRADPANRLLWRMNRRRLDGEALRDAVLAVTGELTAWVGGPRVRVPLEPEVYELIFTEGEPDNLWPVTPDVREHSRRALYLFNKRNVRLPLLETFDQPDTLTSCPVRAVTTSAPQALLLLNGPFLHARARALAGRLAREAGDDPARQVRRAYEAALGRPPRAGEVRTALAFLAAQTALLRGARGPGGAGAAKEAALADFCLAMLNRNAFVYVD
jgi:hypothetical protein